MSTNQIRFCRAYLACRAKTVTVTAIHVKTNVGKRKFVSQSAEDASLYCKPCPKLSDVDISISSSFRSHFKSILSAFCHCLPLQCWHNESSELSCSDDKFASGLLCSSLAQPVPVHTWPTSLLAEHCCNKKPPLYNLQHMEWSASTVMCTYTPSLEFRSLLVPPKYTFFWESSAERDSAAKPVGSSIIS